MVRFNSTMFASLLYRLRILVLVAWIALGASMAAFIMSFISATSQEFDPPSGTQAFDADVVLAKHFPLLAHQTTFAVFVHCDGCDVLGVPSLKAFINASVAAIADLARRQYEGKDIMAIDYFDLIRMNLTVTAQQLVSASQEAILIPITTQFTFTSETAQSFGTDMEARVRAVAESTLFQTSSWLHHDPIDSSGVSSSSSDPIPTNIVVGFSGVPLFIRDVVDTIKTDMALMDAIVLPIAFAVLAYTVRSVRMLLLPIATIALTLSISFGLMYFVAVSIAVSSTAPSLMMSLCIAMSVDYNLFIITRYIEEVKLGNRGADVVSAVIATAGHTIFISGFTLMLACMGLLFFPMGMLRSFGMGCALAIAVAMLVSLSFCPALLLTFPTFFEASAEPFRMPCTGGRFGSKDAVARRAEAKALLSPHDDARSESAVSATPTSVVGGGLDIVASHTSLSNDRDHRWSMEDSFFYHLRFILKFPWNVLTILIVFGIVGALVVPLLDFHISDAFEVYLARGSSFRSEWMRFIEDFGYGATMPYHLIFEISSESNATVCTSEAFWNASQAILQRVVTASFFPPHSTNAAQFYGPLLLGGVYPTWQEVQRCCAPNGCSDNVNFEAAVATGISADGKAIEVSFFSSFSPTGDGADAVYHNILHLIDASVTDSTAARFGAPPMRVFLTGLGPRSMDAIDRIYDLFPVIVGVTMTLVFVVVLIAFRTPIVPLRSVVSIATTEVFTFALAKLVYQSPGVLQFLHWSAVEPQGAITWIVPIVVFTVVAGVALDYDVFLLTRIAEYLFVEGNSPNTSTLKGLCATGSVITAAGVIMAIAFFGLMLSSTPALNLLGFFLVVAVLFDTFVVRTFLVPATMSLLGALNWWPRSVIPRSGSRTRSGFFRDQAAATTAQQQNYADGSYRHASSFTYPYIPSGAGFRRRATEEIPHSLRAAAGRESFASEDEPPVGTQQGTPVTSLRGDVDYGAV